MVSWLLCLFVCLIACVSLPLPCLCVPWFACYTCCVCFDCVFSVCVCFSLGFFHCLFLFWFCLLFVCLPVGWRCVCLPAFLIYSFVLFACLFGGLVCLLLLLDCFVFVLCFVFLFVCYLSFVCWFVCGFCGFSVAVCVSCCGFDLFPVGGLSFPGLWLAGCFAYLFA